MGRGTRDRGQGTQKLAKGNLDPTDIFAALNAARITYLVVGGIAVVLYGVNRLTWDVDLAVELTAENLGSLETILKRIGFSRRIPAPIQGLADPKVRKQWTEQKGMKVYSFMEQHPPGRIIDVMVKPLRNFRAVYARRVTVTIQGIKVPLIPVDLLAQMKREAGRPEDLLDLKALRELGRI